jgi:phosphoenolpyruvate synthase/pyruvate phosphate dikinase
MAALVLPYGRISGIIDERLEGFRGEILGEIRHAVTIFEKTNLQLMIRLKKRAEFLGIDVANRDYSEFTKLLTERVNAAKQEFCKGDERYIVTLKNTGTYLKDFVGNKAAEEGNALNRVLPKDVFVPDGFTLTTLGIEELLKTGKDTNDKINDILSSGDTSEEKAAAIETLLHKEGFPESVTGPLLRRYHDLERGASLEYKFDELRRIANLAGVPDEVKKEIDKLEKKTKRAAKLKDRGYNGKIEQKPGPLIEELIDKLKPRVEEFFINQLKEVYKEDGGVGVFVAVRSSSLIEDTVKTAAAGRFKTYVYIRGYKGLIDAALKCTAHYWAEYGQIYPLQPVFFQCMADAEASVVVNTINANTHNWDEITINSSWGAGVGLMSGEVPSDTFVVDFNSGEIKESKIVPKEEKYVFDEIAGTGATKVRVEDFYINRPSLEPETIEKIRQLAVFLRDTHGYPLDIEIVVIDKKVYVVQVRPIPALFSKKITPAVSEALLMLETARGASKSL